MQAIDPFASSRALLGVTGAPLLLERIEQLAGELQPGEGERIKAVIAESERAPESVRDAVSTRLMECFRHQQTRGVFGLLYELNGPHLLIQVAVRDSDHLRDVVLAEIASLDGVVDETTSLIFEHRRKMVIEPL